MGGCFPEIALATPVGIRRPRLLKIWVLAADSSRARLLATDSPIGELQELENFDFPESRLHGRDIRTDRPGRAFDNTGQGRTASRSAYGKLALPASR